MDGALARCIANALGAKNIVLWLAREGTLCAESKDPVEKIGQLIDSIDDMLAYDDKIKVLCDHNYGANGEMVGLDVKAMRTQKPEDQYRHIQNSMKIALMLEEKVDKFDRAFQAQCIAERNYEMLEMYVMELLMGVC